jgi:hypothetical protein
MSKKLIYLSLFVLLIPAIGYGFIVVGGNTNTSPAFPIVTTNVATSVTATTATLNGTAYNYGSAGLSYFNYGLTSSYGTQTSQVAFGANTSTQSFSANIVGLTISVTYHFQACVSNATGISCGGDLTFVTVGVTRLAAYPTGIANPTAMVINSTLDYLYVAGGVAFPKGMLLDASGGLYVTTVGGSNLIVSKIRVSDFVITNTTTLPSAGIGLYRLLASDLSVQATNGGLGLHANSLWTDGTYIGGVNEGVNGQLAYILLPINTHTTVFGNLGAGNQLHAGVINAAKTVCYNMEYTPGRMVKSDCGNFISQITIEPQSDYNSMTSDATNIYVGGQYNLSKVNMSAFTLTTQTAFAEISPNAINPPTRVCLSSTNYVYCARESFTSPSTYNPSWVTTIRKSDMVELPVLTLQSGEDQLIAGAIDNTNNLMYLLSFDNGSIVKFSITP